jgi:peptidoglycan/xylan/chitin deacetylase (PgdA/CDA1 family)
MRAILTYHSIDRSGSPISISPDVFEQHVRWLASGRVRVVSIDELMMLSDGDDAVALTFDDGFENFATEAWPRLTAHGLTATLFVVSRHAGGFNDWGVDRRITLPRLPLLGWEALARLAEEGVQLGAHSRTHPDLTRLHHTAAVDEIEGSADDIRQRTGRVAQAFAYPFGRVTPGIAALAGGCFRWAVTADLRWLGPTDAATGLPRLDAYYFRQPARLTAWGTWRFRTLVRGRAAGRRVQAALATRPAC